MTLVMLCLVTGLIWLQLTGLGLFLRRATGDYAVARTGGVLMLCLGLFFLEHFRGWGPQLWVMPCGVLASAWLVWRDRKILAAHWPVEAWFMVGFLYCLLWRWVFPDINDVSERVGNLAFIQGYMTGETLPPPDRWFPPYRANFYYSFQHYGAALLGRWMWLEPGMAYHLAYCTVTGLIASAVGMTAARWGRGRLAPGFLVAVLLLGGSGTAVAAYLLMGREPNVLDCVRFVGGTIAHGQLNALGLIVRQWSEVAGVAPRDLPMEPLAHILAIGDYHPPLSGHLLLALAMLIIATLENETGDAQGGRRKLVLHGMVGMTVPLALICNAWIFPLQAIVVAGWAVYRTCRGERRHWLALAVGGGLALLAEAPYLREFLRQAAMGTAAIRWTAPQDHTPWIGWWIVFWPVVGVLGLTLCNRERRAFAWFMIVLWTLLLAGTECFYNDDLYADQVGRFNTSMKWWPWVYAGILLTAGASNLGARSVWCRWGTVVCLLPTCVFAYTLGRQMGWDPKPSVGQLHGGAWIGRDPVIQDMITALAVRPDGILMESGLAWHNTEAPAIALFSKKICLLGWPEHQATWRGPLPEISGRMREIEDFYQGREQDPLGWLLRNDVRYVTWLVRDNGDENVRFAMIWEKISSRYRWHGFAGNDRDFAVGFWERTPAGQPVDREGPPGGLP